EENAEYGIRRGNQTLGFSTRRYKHRFRVTLGTTYLPMSPASTGSIAVCRPAVFRIPDSKKRDGLSNHPARPSRFPHGKETGKANTILLYSVCSVTGVLVPSARTTIRRPSTVSISY